LVLRATTVEAGQRCEGCDGSSTDCRARLGACCLDCTCAPPPGPQPHREACNGGHGQPWDDLPCPLCPCAACRLWAPQGAWNDTELAAWSEAIVEAVYLCIAYRCGHRWLETTSPAYRHPDHCKVCGRRRQVITRGLGALHPADAFVFDRDDGLGPMF
jgi:hypothetical protein